MRRALLCSYLGVSSSHGVGSLALVQQRIRQEAGEASSHRRQQIKGKQKELGPTITCKGPGGQKGFHSPSSTKLKIKLPQRLGRDIS